MSSGDFCLFTGRSELGCLEGIARQCWPGRWGAGAAGPAFYWASNGFLLGRATFEPGLRQILPIPRGVGSLMLWRSRKRASMPFILSFKSDQVPHLRDAISLGSNIFLSIG